MILTHSCIVTNNLDKLRTFYGEILQIEPRLSDQYAEFATEGGTLSLWTTQGAEREAPGALRSDTNRSIMLEFRVSDVDQQYARMDIRWVKHPAPRNGAIGRFISGTRMAISLISIAAYPAPAMTIRCGVFVPFMLLFSVSNRVLES